MFLRLLSYTATLVAGFFMANSSAYAQNVGIDVASDISAFQPVALGENVSLSPCGGSVVKGSGAFISSICDTSRPDLFSINYLISFGGTTSALMFGNGDNNVGSSISTLATSSGGTAQNLGTTASSFSGLSLATGAGTLFSTAGTYVISLITSVKNGQTFAVPTGGNQKSFNDGGLEIAGSGVTVGGSSVGNFNGAVIGTITGNSSTAATANGFRNVAFAQTTLIINEAVSVPEPSAWLMLLVSLFLVGRYQSRRVRSGTANI